MTKTGKLLYIHVYNHLINKRTLTVLVCPVSGNNSRPPSRCVQNSARLPTDEKLGFEAAVAALGM